MNTNIFLRGYTMNWDTPESDSLHLEYSYDENIWYALNGGNAVYFPSVGSKQLINPRLRELEEGGFEVIAEDKKDSTLFIKCKTNDFITYTDEQLIMSSSMVMVDQTLGHNEPLVVSEDIMKPLWALYGRPEPVTTMPSMTLEVTAGKTLPESVEVPLTNGGTANYRMDWGKLKGMAITEDQTVTAHAVEHRYCNPFIMHRADPFIYHHTDGSYYFTASYTDAAHNLEGTYQYRKILLRRAITLDDLADNSGKYDEVCVFEREPLSNGASPHIWAPEIHFVQGKWYIYYTTTIADNTPWTIRPHVMECADADPITGTWKNIGLVQKDSEDNIAFTDFSLDHTVFEHNGELYMAWAQKCPTFSDLLIAKMSNPWTVKSPAVKITTPEYSWEKHGFKV
ncbi:MAG: family 43 glycosylhydrolase, partial [Lachnospiraceae bacterium]|nr:family 43 glycosylhydrolase [Lachnospiraceae bacterium]